MLFGLLIGVFVIIYYVLSLLLLIIQINLLRRKESSFSAIEYSKLHYENTPMQYTAIFHGCKNVYF